MSPLAELARAMFAAALDAVQPHALLRQLTYLGDGVAFQGSTLAPRGRLVVVGIGKAAPGLVAAFLSRCRRPPDEVFVLAPHTVPAPPEVATVLRRGAHPVPDADGERATAELLGLLSRLTPRDGVLLLLSGGASALLAQPLPGLQRSDVAELTLALLRAGASIAELNTVRKHLLAASGGRLAAACPAPILSLLLSDVPGDDPATIASGPTVGDPTTFADAAAVLRRRALAEHFPRVADFFAAGMRGEVGESPKPGDPALRHSQVHLLGSSRQALEAAAEVAAGAGLAPVTLTRTLRGEARAVGEALGTLARHLEDKALHALLAAGETTVTVRGPGRGGRNLEAALAAAFPLRGAAGRCVLVAASDGVDGAAPAAGAVVDGDTLRRGCQRGRDAARDLATNDSWGFFQGSEEAILTGPTGTNVADLAFVLASGRHAAFAPARGRRPAQVQLPAAPGCHPRHTRKAT